MVSPWPWAQKLSWNQTQDEKSSWELETRGRRQNVFNIHPLRWVIAGVARGAEARAFLTTACLRHPVKGEIGERISLNELTNLLNGLVGRDEIALRRRINAV